jgi:hypothetical protein
MQCGILTMSSYNSSTNKSNTACWDAVMAPVVVVVVVVVVLRALAAVAAAVACCSDGEAWRSCYQTKRCSLSGGTPSQSWASPRQRAHSRWTSEMAKKIISHSIG